MHSLTPTLLFLLPSLVLAAPPTPPRISKLTFSGSGCARDNSAKSTSGSLLDDSASFTFADLKGDDSDNCQVHITSQGGSQGWQVAVKEVTYSGDVSLKTGSSLEALTSVFWSENAASTSTLRSDIACTGPAINDSFSVKQTADNLVWSKCTGSDGYPGILNVNFRPIIQGNSGTYNIKSGSVGFVWRQC